MTLRTMSFVTVGNQNGWCEPFLESLCEKVVIVVVGTLFSQLRADSPSHIPLLKLALTVPGLKLRKKEIAFLCTKRSCASAKALTSRAAN